MKEEKKTSTCTPPSPSRVKKFKKIKNQGTPLPLLTMNKYNKIISLALLNNKK